MAYIVADRVKETTVVTGTGPATLLGAVSGYRSFASQLSIGDTCAYAIVNANASEWEVGIGTYSASNTLTRTTVHASTNSNAAVVFTAGTKDVFLSPTAETVLSDVTSTDGTVTLTKTGSIVDLSVAVAAAATNVVVQVRNDTGAPLTKGTVVYINNAIGQIPTVAKALATSDNTSAQTLGMISADLANNSNGFVTIIGLITGLNTQDYNDGDQLYLSDSVAGTFTNVKPYSPSHLVYVGIVEYKNPSNGKIFVKVQNGYELDELHDVSAQNPSDGQTIVYNSTNQLWEKNYVSRTNSLSAVPVVSGAGNSLTLAAGSGVGTGAGGSLILQAGIQATTGGDGKVIVKQSTGQTSNLQEWQNSSATTLSYIDTAGRVTARYLTANGGTYAAATPAITLASGAGAAGFYWDGSYIRAAQGSNSGFKFKADSGQLILCENGQPGSTSGQLLVSPGSGGGAQVNCLAVKANPNQGTYLMYTVTGHGTMTIAPDVPSVSCATLNGSAAYSLTATTKALTSNVATITVSGGTPRVDIGDTIVVALSPADPVFDGTYTITAKTGGNLSYARTNANVTSTATGGTVSSTATATLQNINIGVPGAKGSVIKAAASQTANLQEWQNSSGTALAYVNASGSLFENIINAIPIPSAATVTAASGNGTTITYTAANTFSVGQIVSVTGLTTTTGSSLNIANMTIATASSTQFTVTNTTVGTAAATQAGTATLQSAGNSVTITAGNGSGVGAGGNIILQPGAQGTSGGNGVTVFRNSAGVEKGRVLESGQFISSTAGVGFGWAPAGATSITHGLRCNNPGQGYITIQGQGNNFFSVDSNNGQTCIAAPSSSPNWRFLLVNGTNSESTTGAWGLSCSASNGVAIVRDGAASIAGGSFAFPPSTTAIATNQNDLILTGSAFQRLNCTSPSSITGVAPPSGGAHVDGRMIRIYNVGSYNLTLSHNSTASTITNRFWNSTGADIVLSTHQYVELIYDSTDNGRGGAGWRVSSVH